MADMNAIFEKLGQMSAKQDAMAEDVKEVKESVSRVAHKVETHEALKNYVLGACGIVAVGIGIGIDYIKNKFSG